MKILFEQFETLAEAPDGIKKLRELILQLAVQGKLVPQDPNEEPVSELLKRIKAEKEKLIAEGKIKKQKPLPPISDDEIPYELPKGWKWCRLNHIFNFIDYRGKTPPKTSNGVKLITAKNVRMGKLNSYPEEFIDRKTYEGWMTRGFPRLGDLLFTTEAPLANVARVNITTEFALAQRIIDLQPYSEVDTQFLMYILMSEAIQSLIKFKATGMTAIGIKSANLKLVTLPLPPLAEQKRIVTKVDSLMALCDRLEEQKEKRDRRRINLNKAALGRLLAATGPEEFKKNWNFIAGNFRKLYSMPENVAELKKAILQLAVQGKLVPQDPNDEPASELLKRIKAEKEKLIAEGKIKKQKSLPPISEEEIPYELPEGWEWVKLKEVSKNIHYGFTASAIPEEKKIRIIRITDIQNDRVNWESVPGCHIADKELHKYLLNNNDILIARTGGTIGKSYIVQDITVKAVFASYLIRIIPSTLIYSRYLKVYFGSALYWKQLIAKSMGTGQPNVNGVSLSNLLVSIPSIEEQKRIVAKVDELMNLCEQLENGLEESKSTSESLLKAVVGGV